MAMWQFVKCSEWHSLDYKSLIERISIVSSNDIDSQTQNSPLGINHLGVYNGIKAFVKFHKYFKKLRFGRLTSVIRLSSSNHQTVIKLSSLYQLGCHWVVIGLSYCFHQVVVRLPFGFGLSSGCHKTVIRLSSGNHKAVIRLSSDCYQAAIGLSCGSSLCCLLSSGCHSAFIR